MNPISRDIDTTEITKIIVIIIKRLFNDIDTTKITIIIAITIKRSFND